MCFISPTRFQHHSLPFGKGDGRFCKYLWISSYQKRMDKNCIWVFGDNKLQTFNPNMHALPHTNPQYINAITLDDYPSSMHLLRAVIVLAIEHTEFGGGDIGVL